MTFSCKACNSKSAHKIWNGFARLGKIGDLSDSKSSAYKCNECHSIFLKQEDPYKTEFFESGKYRSDVDGLEKGDYKLYFSKHSKSVFSNLEYIPLNKILGGNYLDFGSGAGILLRLLSSFINKGVGVELDKAYHFKKGNIFNVANFSESDKLVSKFDLITCFSVIGQVENPKKLFRQFKERLNLGGLLLIGDINSEDILLKEATEAYSSVFFRQSYLNYFSVKGLKHLSEETGLMHLSTHYEQRYNYKNYLSFISPGQKSKEINWEHMNVKHKLKTEEKGISDYMYLIFRKDKDNQEK